MRDSKLPSILFGAMYGIAISRLACKGIDEPVFVQPVIDGVCIHCGYPYTDAYHELMCTASSVKSNT